MVSYVVYTNVLKLQFTNFVKLNNPCYQITNYKFQISIEKLVLRIAYDATKSNQVKEMIFSVQEKEVFCAQYMCDGEVLVWSARASWTRMQ